MWLIKVHTSQEASTSISGSSSQGQPANISKEINLTNKRKENRLSLQDEVELKNEILQALY